VSPVLRKEDPRLLRGAGRFADDTAAQGQVWARVVRSAVASGRIRGVQTKTAATADGVLAVVTAADLPPGLAIPMRLPLQGIDLDGYLQPVLATGVVRYVGEPLAVVVAEDPYAAEDAAELVDAEIDETPAVLDAAAATGPAAPRLFPGGNVAADFTLGFGDVDAAFAEAAQVVETTVAIGRHTAVPLEPRALLAVPEPDGRLSVYGMTKVPVFNRGVLAAMLGLDDAQVHGHAADAGGGFGVRGEFYPEDFLVPWLARMLGRPVKWAEDRAEHLVAVNHSRQQEHRLAAAFDAGGRLLGLRADVLHDNGAYCRTHGITVPELTVAMLPGPYRVPAYAGRIQVVVTNKTPCGTYRAPGRFEGTTAREQLLDVAADRLGLDRFELRWRNLLGPAELPHRRAMSTLGTDVVLDAGDYPGLLAATVAEADRLGYQALLNGGPPQASLGSSQAAAARPGSRALRGGGPQSLLGLDQAAAERRGSPGLPPSGVSPIRRGLGVAVFLEKSGLGPHETADVEVGTDGTVRVLAGGTSLGQGVETVLARIAADALGVDPGVVSVVCGDTDLQPAGVGSWASRTTVVAGNAVHAAAAAVREQLVDAAAGLLEAAPGDLTLTGGVIGVRGDPTASLTLAQVAAAVTERTDAGPRDAGAGGPRAGAGAAWPEAEEAEPEARAGAPRAGADALGAGATGGAVLAARRRFDVSHMTYPYGVHIAVVEVDTGTGGVRVLRYLIGYEVGRAVSRELVAGQLRGGAAQGIGGGLLEEFGYDEAGQPLATTFMDYRMPTAAEVPRIDVLVLERSPAPGNPLGLRGAGEGGVSASGAVLASAVRDALGLPGSVGRLPLTPPRVQALAAASGGDGSGMAGWPVTAGPQDAVGSSDGRSGMAEPRDMAREDVR
jgi:carbon-monoxide dehydrogenase large subunit